MSLGRYSLALPSVRHGLHSGLLTAQTNDAAHAGGFRYVRQKARSSNPPIAEASAKGEDAA